MTKPRGGPARSPGREFSRFAPLERLSSRAHALLAEKHRQKYELGAGLALPFTGAACIASAFEWIARLIWAAVAVRNANLGGFRAA